MANLLPTQERLRLSGERRRRFRCAVLILLSGMFAFSAVLLIPSMVALIAARESGEKRLATTRGLIEVQKYAGAAEAIAATKEKIEILRNSETYASPHELIERILPLLPAGVMLNAFNFVRENGSVRLELSGNASNRNALIAFGDTLRGSGLFTSVVIPIESLAQASDLRFRLSLNLADNAPLSQ